MPVYATRKLRNLATALVLVSGISHVAQLWFVELDGPALITALIGMFYLLICLGLAGASRFTLWIGVFIPALAAGISVSLLPQQPMLLVHTATDAVVIAICGYILVRTRHAEMD